MSIFNAAGTRRVRASDSMDMCEGPLFGKIIRYTIPIILSSVLQLLFNAADMAVVGQFKGSLALAAVGATGSITALLVNLFMGLSVGVSVTTAQAIGAGEKEKISRTVHTTVPTAFLGGAVLMVVGLIFSRELLEVMDTPSDVIDQATLYMRICFGGMVFNMLYNFGAAILRAAGDTKGPLRYLTLAGILNVVLNLFFVLVLDMSVDGVAIATVISQGLSSLLVLRALLHRTDACRLFLTKMKFHRKELGAILRIGLPAGIQSTIFSIANVLLQSSINSFGSAAMSGNAAASNVDGFVYTIMYSFSQTAINFSGQNYGARKFDRIRKVRRLCLASVAIAGICSAVIVYLLRYPLLSIYITDSPEALEFAMTRLVYVCLPYFTCGLMDTMTSLTRGLGSSLGPMITTVIGVCGFRIGWILLVFPLPEFHSMAMLYLAYPISWTATLIAHYISHLIIFKRREKAYQEGRLA